MDKNVIIIVINRLRLIFVWGLLVLCSNVVAQEIEVSNFTTNYYSSDYDIPWTKSSDYAIVFIFSNKKIDVDANLGILHEQLDKDNGALILYLPKGTTSFVFSYRDVLQLNYELPKPLKARTVYKMDVDVQEKGKEQNEQNKQNGVKQGKDNNPNMHTRNQDIYSSHNHQASAKSSDIQISDFKHNLKSLTASIEPEYDRQGAACAVIRYTVNDENFEIDPNLGSIKTIRKPGEIIQYVPQGTKRLTVRNGSYMPLRDYYIPIEIESKATYDVVLSLTDKAIKRQKASPDHDNYLGIGYNDPSLSFSSEGGTRRFTIHCNTSWDISAPSWCKLSKNSGTGVMEIEVTAKNNSTVRSRHGVIGIQSQDITVTIVVEQGGK